MQEFKSKLLKVVIKKKWKIKKNIVFTVNNSNFNKVSVEILKPPVGLIKIVSNFICSNFVYVYLTTILWIKWVL